MSRPRIWVAVCRAADTEYARVLGVIAALVTILSTVVAVVWVVACFVCPLLWELACFLFHNPVWLALIPLCLLGCFVLFLVVLGAVAAITGGSGGGCCSPNEYSSLAEYRGQRLTPCSGGIVTFPHDSHDCIRVDPFDDCYRTEPCIGLSYGRDGYVDPFPKLPPCSDILDESGVINPAYLNLDCVHVDAFDPCYRPVTC